VEMGSPRVSSEACGALTSLALRDRKERYLVAPPSEQGLLAAADPPPARLRAWLADPRLRMPVGIFAAHALARADDRAAIPRVEALTLAAGRGTVHHVEAL